MFFGCHQRTMPFWYYIPIPALPEPGAQVIRLVEWLVQDGEEFHAGTRLAIVETASRRFAVMANGDGFVREKLSPVGAELSLGTSIATADADGENIPYGRPYSIAEWIDPGGERST
jgi:pyruvate/2-oxoglutarate dehydrogenase complex dihydrolipoamide acyltransferase (E2) component